MGKLKKFSLNKEKFLERKKQQQQYVSDNVKYDLTKVPDTLREARDPRLKKWYPIYSPKMESYQMDLTFHRIKNKKNLMQAVLTIINVNTRFGYAQPMPYQGKITEDEDWKPADKQGNRKPRGINKDPKKTLNAFIKSLLYLAAWGRRVSRVFTDEGSEFKNEMMKSFCENPMKYIVDNRYYQEQYLPKWSKQAGMDPPLKSSKGKPTVDTVFGGKFKIDPIELIIFNPNEGSKRKLAIVERFNRTVKATFRKIGLIMNDNNESQWNKERNTFATLYNMQATHHGLLRFFKKHMDPEDYEVIAESGISPADVDDDMEAFIISKKQKETAEIDTYYKKHKYKIKIGMKVRYRVVNAWDEESNFPDAFLKKSYGWSKDVYTVKRHHPRRKGGVLAGRTYILEKDGEEHRRRFLPWELRVVDKTVSKQDAEDREDTKKRKYQEMVDSVSDDEVEKLDKAF